MATSTVSRSHAERSFSSVQASEISRDQKRSLVLAGASAVAAVGLLSLGHALDNAGQNMVVGHLAYQPNWYNLQPGINPNMYTNDYAAKGMAEALGGGALLLGGISGIRALTDAHASRTQNYELFKKSKFIFNAMTATLGAVELATGIAVHNTVSSDASSMFSSSNFDPANQWMIGPINGATLTDVVQAANAGGREFGAGLAGVVTAVSPFIRRGR